MDPLACHGPCRCSSSTDKAMLANSGDRMPPYEQRWVMRSVRGLPPVEAVATTERCA